MVEELAVLVGKEEELGESGGCEERFHSQAKKRPGPDSDCHAGRRQTLICCPPLSTSWILLLCALFYNWYSFSLLYLRKSY